MVEKFAQKNPSCIVYDEKLQFYSNLVVEVWIICEVSLQYWSFGRHDSLFVKCHWGMDINFFNVC